MTSEMTRRNQTRWKLITKAKAQGNSKGKEAKSDKQDKECYACGKKWHFARDCWSRANQDRTVNEVEGAKVDSDAAKEFVCTIENIVKDVTLSQSGCEGHEDGLVMIDRRASVNVCPKWFLFLFNHTDHFDSEVRTEELQDYGKRQLWSSIGHYLRRHDFHVALAQAACSFCVGVFCVQIAGDFFCDLVVCGVDRSSFVEFLPPVNGIR